MSEKIIITVEQDELIKDFLIDTEKSDVLKQHARGWSDFENLSMNTLTFDEMARILYEPNSYEVEQPPFVTGEWVAYISSNRVFKVMSVLGNIVTEDENISTISEVLRHATKEEIFWAELGRSFRQFRWDDCLVLRNGETLRVLSDRCEVYAESHFEKNGVSSFYPADSRVKFPK